jgi:CxxC motif-containing protein
LIDETAFNSYENKAILTTMVRIKGSKLNNVVPVKSSKPIDKKLWIECSKALSRIHVGPPLRIGDIVCKNILNTGVDIICTKNIDINNG